MVFCQDELKDLLLFSETSVPPEVFIDKMAANPMHVAAGDYVRELLHFCALSEIEPVLLN
jgi:hypothetical protein